MGKNELVSQGELAIAKAEMEANKRGISSKEINANRELAWIQKSLVLFIIVSLCFGTMLGGINTTLLVMAFWMVTVPVFLFLKRRRLNSIRNEQLKKFKEENV